VRSAREVWSRTITERAVGQGAMMLPKPERSFASCWYAVASRAVVAMRLVGYIAISTVAGR